ncbi:hypothetical protein AB0E59_40050 [Lentzea sp. NPDC034063]|uniref:hypothetical protein n=1 Tax=unclassified Lentzea TaxID=2643253 RepID=UPI0033F689DE
MNTEWVDIFETIEDMEPAGEMYGGLSQDYLGAKPFQPGKKPQLEPAPAQGARLQRVRAVPVRPGAVRESAAGTRLTCGFY